MHGMWQGKYSTHTWQVTYVLAIYAPFDLYGPVRKGSGSTWIRIGLAPWIWIRIEIKIWIRIRV